MSFQEQFTTVTPFSKRLALFLFFLLPVISFIYGTKYQKLQNLKETSSAIVTPTLIPSATNYEELFMSLQEVPSATGRYIFNYYPIDNTSNKCKYFLKTYPAGGIWDMKDLIPSKTIDCTPGYFGGWDSKVLGWKGADKLLMELNEGEILILDIRRNTKKVYNYDKNLYQFNNVDSSLNFWLLRDNLNNKNKAATYYLFDRNQKLLREPLEYNYATSNMYGISGVHYDELNNGFLFVSNNYVNSTVSAKFDWLSLDNLTLKTILTTSFVQTAGRDCGTGNEIVSTQKGTLLMTSDCISIDEKYKDAQGNIVIPL